jgi:hypothetical protein
MIELHMHDIQTFLRCQKKFEYAVYRGFEPVTNSESIRRGSCIHALLSAHFRGEPEADTRDRISQDPDFAEFFEPSYDVYRRYLTEVAAQEDWEVLSVEETHEVPLKRVNVKILLRPDLVIRDRADGQLKILDFKTTQQFPANQRPEMDIDVQMLTYSWAWWLLHGEIPRFQYEYIRREMPARPETRFHARITMHRSEAELINYEQELFTVLRSIREVFEPLKSPQAYRSIIHAGGESCGSCPFLTPCMAELLQGRKISDDLYMAMGYKKGDHPCSESILATTE